MYINVKIGEAYYLQMSGVLRCEAGRVFTLVTVAWLIDCQCLVRLQGDTRTLSSESRSISLFEHIFPGVSGWGTFDRFSIAFGLKNFCSNFTVRCRISYIPSLPISPFCLLFAKSKKAMYNVWGWGGLLLELKSIYHFFQSLRSMGF